jgi:hypothetical protein
MRGHLLIPILLTAALWPSTGLAADCPIEATGDKSFAEAVMDALSAAPDCKEAVKLGQLCGFGSALDVDAATIVIDTCEKAGLSKLSGQKSVQYAKASEACDRKYAHREGSLYVGLAALCREKIAGQFLAN